MHFETKIRLERGEAWKINHSRGSTPKSPLYSLGNEAAWNIKYIPGSEIKFPAVHFETKIRLERGEAWKINHFSGAKPTSPLYILEYEAAWKINHFRGSTLKSPLYSLVNEAAWKID